tara:strand:+ start:276 stop:512 length:237 start_codon:yes stop_codon:yes gene_type:complete
MDIQHLEIELRQHLKPIQLQLEQVELLLHLIQLEIVVLMVQFQPFQQYQEQVVVKVVINHIQEQMVVQAEVNQLFVVQ